MLVSGHTMYDLLQFFVGVVYCNNINNSKNYLFENCQASMVPEIHLWCAGERKRENLKHYIHYLKLSLNSDKIKIKWSYIPPLLHTIAGFNQCNLPIFHHSHTI